MLKCALAAAGVFASPHYVSNDFSFGHNGKISPNGLGVPNYFLLGSPNAPEILSNKIILTPPAPGNQRGAAWSEKRVDLTSWTVELEFRATGPERGGGNFNFWYVKEGSGGIGSASIYTVGKFEGLAIVIDTYGGSGGTIRGFLNDGSKNYRDLHIVDGLAFGHCQYSYRNLGRPSDLKIEHTAQGGLKVQIDGSPCFESSKIILPKDNYIGISAASAETPDSFEVFKLAVSGETTTPPPEIPSSETTPPASSSEQYAGDDDANVQFEDDPSFVPADSIIDHTKQFQDLHNRLQSVMKHVSAFQRDMNQYKSQSVIRHNELKSLVTSQQQQQQNAPQQPPPKEFPFAQVTQMEKKLLDMDHKIDQILKQVEDPKRWVDLHQAVREQHNEVFRHLPEKIAMHIPNSGLIAFFVVALQAVLMVGYFWWKRRLAGMPKKYL